jgi:hypothetical protein
MMITMISVIIIMTMELNSNLSTFRRLEPHRKQQSVDFGLGFFK